MYRGMYGHNRAPRQQPFFALDADRRRLLHCLLPNLRSAYGPHRFPNPQGRRRVDVVGGHSPAWIDVDNRAPQDGNASQALDARLDIRTNVAPNALELLDNTV